MPRNRAGVAGGLILITIGLVLVFFSLPRDTSNTAYQPPATQSLGPTPEPLIPTRTRALENSRSVAAILTTTPSLRLAAKAGASLWQGRTRWGVGVATGPISRYDTSKLLLGWYLDWQAVLDPPKPDGVEYVQMVRLKSGYLQPDEAGVARIARANPGSIWLIGNEPDVKWQDNVVPSAYAELYHRAYLAVKTADPTAQVAIGGVSQPTPLRLRYLEMILVEYQKQFGAEMLVDVWNIHNFVLREERGSWGVEIPPGMTDDRGMLYEVDDSGNLEIFQRHIVDFRRWMSARGYQNRPLIVSEYGIPMPEDYGFPPQRVSAFQRETFDFFLDAVDLPTGYALDDRRLVQRWCWFSLDDTAYPTGRLFDPTTREISGVGKTWQEYAKQRQLMR